MPSGANPINAQGLVQVIRMFVYSSESSKMAVLFEKVCAELDDFRLVDPLLHLHLMLLLEKKCY